MFNDQGEKEIAAICICVNDWTYSETSSRASALSSLEWLLRGNESTRDAGAGLETMDRESDTGWRWISSKTWRLKIAAATKLITQVKSGGGPYVQDLTTMLLPLPNKSKWNWKTTSTRLLGKMEPFNQMQIKDNAGKKVHNKDGKYLDAKWQTRQDVATQLFNWKQNPHRMRIIATRHDKEQNRRKKKEKYKKINK